MAGRQGDSCVPFTGVSGVRKAGARAGCACAGRATSVRLPRLQNAAGADRRSAWSGARLSGPAPGSATPEDRHCRAPRSGRGRQRSLGPCRRIRSAHEPAGHRYAVGWGTMAPAADGHRARCAPDSVVVRREATAIGTGSDPVSPDEGTADRAGERRLALAPREPGVEPGVRIVEERCGVARGAGPVRLPDCRAPSSPPRGGPRFRAADPRRWRTAPPLLPVDDLSAQRAVARWPTAAPPVRARWATIRGRGRVPCRPPG